MAQGRVRQMGGGVVGARAPAPLGIHQQPHALAGLEPAFDQLEDMHVQIAGQLLGVEHQGAPAGPFGLALVAGLAAALGVEGSVVEQHADGFAGARRVHLGAAPHQGQDLGHRLDLVIAGEHRRAEPLAQGQPLRPLRRLARAGPGLARHLALAIHGGLEAFQVDGDLSGPHRVLGQVERKAVGVVQLEGGLAGQHPAGGQTHCRLVQQGQTPAQGAAEAFLLLAQGFDDQRARADQFGIGRAHLLDQGGRETVHQGVLRAQQMGVAHGPAHDPAQHIAAPLVGRRNPVGDQKAARAQMVGDDPVRGGVVAHRRDAGQLDAGGDQGAEQVDVEDVVDALQDRGDPLQPHAGVDRRLGQGRAHAVSGLIVLHEDQVPELDEPVAVLVGRAGRAAGDVGAVVVEDLRTGTAGAGVAHRPHVVGVAHDAVVGNAGDLAPEDGGLLVAGVDGDPQPVLRQGEVAADQGPGQLDRALLEVVAEREVAEHLEEGAVAGGVADIVEVVVLAARAHALLRRGGPGRRRALRAGEDVLERDHPGVDEEQGGVAARHQRRGRDHRVVLAGEVAQEGATDLVQAGHRRSVRWQGGAT
jgi:hypothetical protein